jgi:hypothetical protein
MSDFKGKERTDRHAVRMYGKDFNSLNKNYSKISALAAALKEAEDEIESLANGVNASDSGLHLQRVMASILLMIESKIEEIHKENCWNAEEVADKHGRIDGLKEAKDYILQEHSKYLP